MKKSEIKAKAQKMEPSVVVGKDGLSRGVMDTLDQQLKKSKIVKVRFHRSALEDPKISDRKALARLLADRTGSELIEVKGLTAVLYRQ